MLPWPDLPPDFPLLTRQATTATPSSDNSKISNVGGHTIPVEIWDHIVSYILNLATLYSLLPTCKRVANVVLRRLYAHPLESIGRHYNHPRRAFERFVVMVLTHSTLDNADTAFLRDKLGITQFGQQPTYINYASLIRQWDLDFARFVYLLKIIDPSATPFLSSTANGQGSAAAAAAAALAWWSSHVQQVHGALFWGMFAMHSLEHLRQIEVDYPDLDRLSARVEELKSLERVSICDMSDNGSRTVIPGVDEQTDEELDRRFKAIAGFVALYVKHHGNARLREIELSRAGLGRKLQEAKLAIFAHLAPLKHLKELNLQNWHRLMARVDETDLSQVRSIELQASDPAQAVEWTCAPDVVLRRCRALEHLAIDANDQDLFAWAVDELQGVEAKRLKQHPSIQPPTPVPLISLAISARDIHFPQVIHDAVVAFGRTLTSMTSETTYEDPNAPEASELVAIDCGSLPALRFLKMFVVDTLVLDTSFLARAPNLQIMSLGDNVSWYWPGNYVYHQPWDLPRLKFLRLDGLMASMFDPSSLRSMPFLVGMALKGPYQAVEHDMELRRDFVRYDPDDDETPGRCYLPPLEEETGCLHNAAAWSWHWFMPQLSMIDLKGEPAYRFSFRFLRWCPVLTELKLHIDRQRRPLRLAEELDEEEEEELRALRKATKRAMGAEACERGYGAAPVSEASPKTLLDLYEVDLQEYARDGSTLAEDEEQKWSWETVGPALQTLTITGLWSISAADIRRMLSNKAFPRLEELKLYRCQHYDEAVLCKAAANHGQLKELTISRQWTRRDQKRLHVVQVDPPKRWRQMRGASILYGETGTPMWDQRFWARTFGDPGRNFVKIKAKGRNFMVPKTVDETCLMPVFMSVASKLTDPEQDERKEEGDEVEEELENDEEKENKEVIAVDEDPGQDPQKDSASERSLSLTVDEGSVSSATIVPATNRDVEDQEPHGHDDDDLVPEECTRVGSDTSGDAEDQEQADEAGVTAVVAAAPGTIHQDENEDHSQQPTPHALL